MSNKRVRRVHNLCRVYELREVNDHKHVRRHRRITRLRIFRSGYHREIRLEVRANETVRLELAETNCNFDERAISVCDDKDEYTTYAGYMNLEK